MNERMKTANEHFIKPKRLFTVKYKKIQNIVIKDWSTTKKALNVNLKSFI